MKQQLIVSGIGGQGVLFLTRVIAQAAVDLDIPVRTSESHGMAQRGGTVLSTIKIGDFAAPLIRTGQGDIGLFLWDRNLAVHRPLLKKEALLVVNSTEDGEGLRLDGTGVAGEIGRSLLANLVLLGAAVKRGTLFCTEADCVKAIETLAPVSYVDQNLKAFYKGLNG